MSIGIAVACIALFPCPKRIFLIAGVILLATPLVLTVVTLTARPANAPIVRIQSLLGVREFKGIQLPGANLRGINLSQTNLRDADLAGANLTGANLSGAKVTQEQFDRAKTLEGATLPDGTKYTDETEPDSALEVEPRGYTLPSTIAGSVASPTRWPAAGSTWGW